MRATPTIASRRAAAIAIRSTCRRGRRSKFPGSRLARHAPAPQHDGCAQRRHDERNRLRQREQARDVEADERAGDADESARDERSGAAGNLARQPARSGEAVEMNPATMPIASTIRKTTAGVMVVSPQG